MSFSPLHTRSGVTYSTSLNMADATESLTATAGSLSSTPSPSSTAHPVHHVSLSPASVPQWSGDDPQYPVFIFIRRLRDALSHTIFNSEQCVIFARQCMSLSTLTPAGAVLKDEFYSNCTDFEAFCDNLIKEFACSSRDLCLTSLHNFSDLLLTNHGTLSPKTAAGLAGRLRTELDYSLKNP